MRASLFPLLAACLAAPLSAGEEPSIPENPAKPKSGLEAAAWTVEAWGNGGSTEALTVGARKLLRLNYEGGARQKVACKRPVTLSASPGGKVRLHVFAPNDNPPAVAVVLCTTPEQLWHEAEPFSLKQGWNSLEMPLTKPHWKTQATEWKFAAGVEQPQDIQAVALVVLNNANSGWLAVEGLRVDPDEATQKVEELVQKLEDKEGEFRAQAEAELVAIGAPALNALRQLRASSRPEVALRAGWAIDKIEAKLEEQRKKEEEQKRVTAQFQDARRRAESLARDLREGRGRLQTLTQDALEELRRAGPARKELTAPSEEDMKAYEKTLDDLEQLAKDLLKCLGPPPPKDAPER